MEQEIAESEARMRARKAVSLQRATFSISALCLVIGIACTLLVLIVHVPDSRTPGNVIAGMGYVAAAGVGTRAPLLGILAALFGALATLTLVRRGGAVLRGSIPLWCAVLANVAAMVWAFTTV